MSAYGVTAETVENNPDIERQWAVKAFHHAETYMRLLKALPPRRMKLTPIDDEIYKDFRETFPAMALDPLDEEELKSEAAKAAWRGFIARYEKRVQDFNFGTLVRLRCAEEYGPDNSTFATRMQFFALEIARNREGCNDAIHGGGAGS